MNIEVRSEMEESLCCLLYSQLSAMGCFRRLPAALAEMIEVAGISPVYERWLEESIAVCVRHQYLAKDGDRLVQGMKAPPKLDAAWQSWAHAKGVWMAGQNRQAVAAFVDVAIQALPDLLSRRRRATDVLFPNGSLSLVQGIYKDNPIADYFNGVLANSVESYVQLRLDENAAAQIRILEVGAGTGGSTAQILRQMRPYTSILAEYCYTDLSNVFLSHGKEEFGRHHPWMTFRILNIDQPLSDQDIAIGAFDLVIASNVLHATPSIRRTLLNVKSALIRNGLVMLNEVSGNSLLTHLTFGLLDGWWLYEDPEIRIPGCPALAPNAWKAALEESGFNSVFFPAADAHHNGQQIVIAESNGLIQVSPFVLRKSGNGHSRIVREVQDPDEPRTRPASRAEAGHVRQLVRARVAATLGLSETEIDDNRTFSDYGVDSINGVNVINAINDALGLALQTIVLFDYSNVNALTDYITCRHGDSIAGMGAGIEPCEADQMQAPAPVSISESDLPRGVDLRPQPGQEDPIAVIGMSGRFGAANSVQELWEHLAAGHDLVSEVSRWDLTRHYVESFGSSENYCRHGSFIEGIDLFDAAFFQISAIEARCMDPQQRLFLEECWKALEDAGYAGQTQYHESCGIYVGCAGGDYQRLFSGSEPGQAFWGNASSIVPARIAYFLNLRGAAIAVDTACSSSLVAIHLACQSLWRGETDLVLAGGTHVQSTPTFYLLSSRGGMLSPTGRCHTFGDQADGFVPGEGVGVVVLKRLANAIADRDHIYGIIRGSSINQDGATNGITAPSSMSQARLECEVYDRFHINAESIQMVEAHGTGTKLGDPIEFEALSRAFRRYTGKSGYCAIGSIKTNIGHTATAAGVAGVIKVLLSLQHQTIPASLHCSKYNPSIAVEGSPFYVNKQTSYWEVPPGEKRRAALSSFGFGGTNAHMVIEEAALPVEAPQEAKPAYWIVLSARTTPQLRQQAQQLRLFVESQDSSGRGLDLNCGDLSYTLLVGRRHFQHRLSCLVCDVRELGSALGKWLETGFAAQIAVSETGQQKRRNQPDLVRYGNACLQECARGAVPSLYLEKLGAAAELYLQGYALDFELLFAHDRFRRISVPTYPFSRVSHWITAEGVGASQTKNADVRSAPAKHPLLQRQSFADSARCCYTSTFTGEEWFLSDHVVQGKKILPAAVQIEMARAAVADALAVNGESRLRLHSIVWSRPVVVGNSPVKFGIRIFEAINGPDERECRYQVFSGESPSTSGEVIHGLGRVAGHKKYGRCAWRRSPYRASVYSRCMRIRFHSQRKAVRAVPPIRD